MLNHPDSYSQNKFITLSTFSTASFIGLLNTLSEAHNGEQLYAVGSEWALASILPYSLLWNWEYESLTGMNFLSCYVTGNGASLDFFKETDKDYSIHNLYIFASNNESPAIFSNPPFGCIRI